MFRNCRTQLLVMAGAAIAAWPGCDAGSQPTTQSAAPLAPRLTAPESESWSREQASAHLADRKLGISAAVRLVRLAEVSPLCVPDVLTDTHWARLRLVALGPERWALGLADRQDERRLRAPVVIEATGEVSLVAEGIEEELAVLHVSKDPDVFPHVVTLPQRVLLINDAVVPAIALETRDGLAFDLRQERGFNYVALLLVGTGAAREVARYRWDPYELTFMGPASDALPDPPGGKFRIDLQASRRLEPVGGEIKEPAPDVGPTEDEWV